jgi:hypothetical protein
VKDAYIIVKCWVQKTHGHGSHTHVVCEVGYVRRQTWNQKLLPLQPVVSPCQRPVDHSATSTQKLTVAVRVRNPSEPSHVRSKIAGRRHLNPNRQLRVAVI